MVATMWIEVKDIYIFEKDDWSVWASLEQPNDDDLSILAVRTYSEEKVYSILNWDMTTPIIEIERIKNKYF